MSRAKPLLSVAIEGGKVEFSCKILLVGCFAIPCLGLLVIFGSLRFVVGRIGGSRIALTRLHLGRGIACIGLGQQSGVDTGSLGGGQGRHRRKDQHQGELLRRGFQENPR